jgi:hypothetical protein
VLVSLFLLGSIDLDIDPFSFCGIIDWQLGQVPSDFGKTRILQLGQV